VFRARPLGSSDSGRPSWDHAQILGVPTRDGSDDDDDNNDNDDDDDDDDALQMHEEQRSFREARLGGKLKEGND
jgi:hypothetical protein